MNLTYVHMSPVILSPRLQSATKHGHVLRTFVALKGDWQTPSRFSEDALLFLQQGLDMETKQQVNNVPQLTEA